MPSGNDRISGKGAPSRPSDDAIIRTLTSLQRSTQVMIIKRMLNALPTRMKVKIFRMYPGIVEAATKGQATFEG
jgi:hypothetical protein